MVTRAASGSSKLSGLNAEGLHLEVERLVVDPEKSSRLGAEQQVMMVVPVDPKVDEAEYVAEIAKHVHDKFKIPSWWCQTVTVGYERIKGLRAIGQRRDGGFEMNKTKTFAVPLGRLYRAWSDARTRAHWLPGVAPTVRTATRNKSMRITWPDQTSVQVAFIGKGPSKSQLSVQHGKLADKAAATRMKAFWKERLAELGALLAPAD